MKITDLKINGMERPMGYAFSNVTVSWRVAEAVSQQQEKTRVEISTDPDFTNIVSCREGRLPCAGTAMEVALTPCTTWYVRVTVTGTEGDTASACGSFDTGKMDAPWTARWIGMPEGCAFHPVLRKSFPAKPDALRARLYICGVGLYEAAINGSKAGDDVLAPFFNDYRCALQTQTYDVTDLLQRDNTLTIALGNGWYKGRLGYNGDVHFFGNQFAAIAELHIQYADGSTQVVATDDSWTVCPGDITASDIYDGETLDRMAYRDSRPEYPAEYVDMSGKKLVDRYSMPLRVVGELPVREIIRTPAGETVLDFGQNFSGFVSFHARAFAPGTTITLEHGEVLQQGNFYHDNYRTAKTRITYISDGRQEWYQPTFTYMGFRYVKVTGWPGEMRAEDFVGRVVCSDMERTGFLETGNSKANRLLSNALWGLKSNFLDMPTDCPQRDERLGWTGDAQVFAPTASFFMDTRAFYRKFAWDLRNDQLLHDGAVANYVPNIENSPGGAAVWADAAAFIPDTVYEAFADHELLREMYPLMKDWVDYVTRGCEAHNSGYLYNFAFTFGDWLAMDGVTDQSMKGGTEDAYISSAYYYASCCRVQRAASVLGLEQEAAYYQALSEKIREAILHEYFTPAGRLAVDTQAGYVIALTFGIWRDKAVLQQGLRSRLQRDGNRIRCGFVGAPLICIALAENGMMDLAMHLFLQEKFPSWLHCVNLGATTIWERWNSLLDDGSISGTGMNSLNHYAYGSVCNFVVRCIAGFTPLEPGYRSVRIAPRPDARLGRLSLRYRSASGEYAAGWQIQEDGSIRLEAEVPFDCSAQLVLPESGEVLQLQPGRYEFTVVPKTDYRRLYTLDSMLDEMSGNPEAMQILKEELPAAWGMACSGDVESLSRTLRELRSMPFFHCPAPAVDRAMARLGKLRAQPEQ